MFVAFRAAPAACPGAAFWVRLPRASSALPRPRKAQVAVPVPQAPALVIDCHGHYTTEPQAVFAWRKRQIAALNDPGQTPRPDELKISDDELRDSVEGAQ